MIPRRLVVTSVFTLALFGCAGACPRDTSATPAARSVPDAEDPLSSERRLVVLVVLDQLGAWVLEHHLPNLPEDGILGRMRREGSYHVGAYPYAGTEAAPGHATLVTGVLPAEHGVMASSYFIDGEPRDAVDDHEHPVIGSSGRYAGPRALLSPTVGDLLKTSSGGASRVVALSNEARSAILPAGDRGDAAIFYDARQGRYTTSTYYAPGGALPTWLAAYQESHPVEERIDVWTPEDPALLATYAGLDDAPGEGRVFGGSRVFPHDPAPDVNALFPVTPAASEYLLELSLGAAEALALGSDDAVDLLSVSISGMDRVGHIFGPHAWEYVDHLRRVDRALARFVRALEARGEVTFVVTADHGVAPLVERSSAAGEAAARLSVGEIEAVARRAAIEAEAPPEWVEAFHPPMLYLDGEVDSRPGLRAAIANAVADHPGIHGAFDVRAAPALRELEDGVGHLVGNSISAGAPGDIYVVPARNHGFEVEEIGDAGTGHGTPWDYDRLVPVLLWGAGVPPNEGSEVVDMRRVATTLASLLGSPPPPGAPTAPLR